jgi:hypothetical protein
VTDDEATVIDLDPPTLVKERASIRAPLIENVPPDENAERRKAAGRRLRPVPAGATGEIGGEDAFILAWGRSHAALRSKALQLFVSMIVNVTLAAAVVFLAWRNERKDPLVFVRDSLGNIVQADAASFLHAGDARAEVEIKGFMRRWVLDAFTWTPLDVEDRLKACLRLVDGKAQAVTRAGLRLAERQVLVERGASGRVYDDKSVGREPQVVITRRAPLEVMVSFDQYLIDKSGHASDAGHCFVRAILKEVPRSSVNPSGLIIADIQVSQNL